MSLLQFFLSHKQEIATLVLEHLWFVGVSIVIAVVIGIPLGILLTRRPGWKPMILGGSNIVQTIPSLALFGLMLPLPWLGARADRLTITALTLYALLPIIRNTFAGISAIDAPVREAATGMGLNSRQLLWHVELPLASPVILAGVRVATVITIGVATIAAAIGAGGLGELIFRGVAMVDTNVILAGAIPAALMALFADVGLGFVQRIVQYPKR